MLDGGPGAEPSFSPAFLPTENSLIPRGDLAASEPQDRTVPSLPPLNPLEGAGLRMHTTRTPCLSTQSCCAVLAENTHTSPLEQPSHISATLWLMQRGAPSRPSKT